MNNKDKIIDPKKYWAKKQKEIAKACRKPSYVKNITKLSNILKPYGGEKIMPLVEPKNLLEWLVKDGRFFDTTKLKLKKGEKNRCHSNSAKLWAKNKDLQLVNGCTLDKGSDLWVEHTWLWNPLTGELIETTNRRHIYFGVVLNELTGCYSAARDVPELLASAKKGDRILELGKKLVLLCEIDKDAAKSIVMNNKPGWP
jgi:hypothetical protein